MCGQVAAKPIQIIEPAKITAPEKVELGKMLYFDPRLSKSGLFLVTHANLCGWCWCDPNLDWWSLATSEINAPTVLNSSYMLAQFGMACGIYRSKRGPIANPKEMGFTHELAIDTVNSMPAYREI